MKTVFFLIKRKVLSHHVHLGSSKDFVKSMGVLKDGHVSASVLCVNAYTLLEASKNQEASLVLDKAKVLIPVGKLLRKGIKWIYGQQIDTISLWKLTDTMFKELEVGVCEYYGDEKFKQRLINRYPEVEIKSIVTPENVSDARITGKLLLVCLPPESQKTWMMKMDSQTKGCVVGLGDLYFKPSFAKRLTHSFLFSGKVLNQKFVNS